MSCVYVRETIKMIPGKRAEYLQAVEREYLPMVKKHGVRLFGFWDTMDLQGDSLEAIAMWEFDNWPHVRRFIEARYSEGKIDKDIREWDEKVWAWIAHKEAKCLTPSPNTPTLEALTSRGFRAKVVMMEDIDVEPGKMWHYHEALEVQLTPIMKAFMNCDLIGYYMGSVAWTATQCFNFWKFGDDWDNIDVFDRMPPYRFELPMVREMMNWGEIAMSLRKDWYDRLLSPVPFSPI